MRIIQIELGILNFMVAVMFLMVMRDSWVQYMMNRKYKAWVQYMMNRKYKAKEDIGIQMELFK